MAPIPPLTPSSPDTPGGRVPARTRSTIADEIVHGSSSAEIILARLRGMVAGGKQDTDTILGTIAVAAHALTGSNGAAIAMPRDGAVVCIGRSGEIAPELGDRLNINSGISGECLRTGTIMRCDDAARDFHVNPEVCRQMGVQSIAVVPLRGQHGRVGVLEAFSSQSYAFTDEHMEILGRLAGLAESAWARTHQKETAADPAEEVLPANNFPKQTVATASAVQPDVIVERLIREVQIAEKRIREKPAFAAASAPGVAGAAVRVQPAIRARRQTGRTEQWWRYATISGLAGVLVILLAIFSWRAWYKASLPVSSTKSADSSQETAPESSDVTGSEVIQEAVAKPVIRRSPTRTATRPSASDSRSDVEIRRLPVTTQAPDLGHANTAAAADSNPPAVEAPQIPESDAKTASVATLLTAPATLPSLKTTNTESFAGGVLVHKVLPIYPAQARQARIQGNVVLEAMISEQGQIEGLKVVSGPPILAPAAVDAVRQWRYTPYLLNGKPIKKQTRINISFIAAQ